MTILELSASSLKFSLRLCTRADSNKMSSSWQISIADEKLMIRPRPPMSPRSEDTIIQKTTHSLIITLSMRKLTFVTLSSMISGNYLNNRRD